MDWNTIGTWATVMVTLVGAVLILLQLNLAYKQATTTFEDSLAREYREITKELPIEAFFLKIDGVLALDIFKRKEIGFYRYFDLCNEQAFLYKKGKKICDTTFSEWKKGIVGNLRRPVFEAAWREINDKTGDFNDLRDLLKG